MLRGGPGPDGAERDRPTHFHSDYPTPVPRAACKMSQTLTATLRSASAVIKDEETGVGGAAEFQVPSCTGGRNCMEVPGYRKKSQFSFF